MHSSGSSILIEFWQSARWVRECCRALVEPRTLTLDLKVPPGLAAEPIAQIIGMPSHELEIWIAARDERAHQQGTHGTFSFLLLLVRQDIFEAARLHDHLPDHPLYQDAVISPTESPQLGVELCATVGFQRMPHATVDELRR